MYENELYHYGVKGMKWGVRRYQNEDGSLTALGKSRLYSDEDSEREFENNKSKLKIGSTLTSSGYKVGGRTIDSADINEAGNFLKRQSTALTDEFNSICNQTKEHYEKLSSNKQFKNEVMAKLKREFDYDDNSMDRDDWRLWVEDDAVDYVDQFESKYMSNKLKKSWDNFHNGVDTYYDNVKNITDDIVGKCGDMTIATAISRQPGLFGKATKTEYKYSDVVEHTLHELGNSTWVRYLNNHTEMAYLEEPAWSAREKLVNEIIDDFVKTKVRN